MTAYRAYLMDTDGHITAAKEFGADGDERALEIAKQHVDGCDVELWDGARKVARLPSSSRDQSELSALGRRSYGMAVSSIPVCDHCAEALRLHGSLTAPEGPITI